VHEDHANFNEALHIYQELYQANPRRVDILYRIESILTRLGRHQDVINLMTERLTKAPGETNARIRLGNALYELGKTDEAFVQWEAILDRAKTEGPFLIVAGLYRKHNLHDRVEAVYRGGRVRLNAPVLFARELARLAERDGRYGLAVAEYLRFLDDKPQYRPVVKQHFREFAGDESQRLPIFRHLAAEVTARPSDRERSLLLIDYAQAAGLLARALRALMDSAEQIAPEAWRQIARVARDAGDYDTAAGAYSRMLLRNDQRPTALIGLALAEEGRGRYDEAGGYYRAVLEAYPEPPTGHEARYRLGRMLSRQQNRLNDALEVLLPLADADRSTDWSEQAAFVTSDLLIRANRMPEAEAILSEIVRSRPVEEADRARLSRAHIDFMQAEFDSSSGHLARLMAGVPTRDVLNDALELAALVQRGQAEYPETLKTLARARRSLRLGNLEEALVLLDSAADRGAEPSGRDHILALRVEVLQALKRPEAVVQACLKLLIEMPNSPIGPAIHITLAETIECDLNDTNRAREAYEKLLLDFPLSLEADIARERIRALRQPGPESNHEAG